MNAASILWPSLSLGPPGEVAGDVGVGEQLVGVAEPLEAMTRLPDLPDLPPLEREPARVHDGLVAHVQASQPELRVDVREVGPPCEDGDAPTQAPYVPD